jgi:endoglucanase
MASIPKPIYWDEIVTFAKMPGGTGNAEKRIAARPSLEHSRTSLDDLLKKIRLDSCSINAGYFKALGLKNPQV